VLSVCMCCLCDVSAICTMFTIYTRKARARGRQSPHTANAGASASQVHRWLDYQRSNRRRYNRCLRGCDTA